ncbi:MAG: hypothetical protein IT384_14195 [Deltaproteobacteria bacterium]|nr:hypothetical protein [Deltaproteobacteria bacterium]
MTNSRWLSAFLLASTLPACSSSSSTPSSSDAQSAPDGRGGGDVIAPDSGLTGSDDGSTHADDSSAAGSDGSEDAGGGPVDSGVMVPRGSATIGPSGGIVLSDDGQLVVQVPEGALSSTLTVTVAAADPSTLPVGTIGTAYVLGPEGTVFSAPVLLTFHLQASELAGLTWGAVRVGTIEAGVWAPLGMTMIDEQSMTAAAVTAHFSIFGVHSEPCSGLATDCFWSGHLDACVEGLAPHPVCAIPCRDHADCPDPLYCAQGACNLRGCGSNASGCSRPGHACTHVYGYNDAPAEYHNLLCLPACDSRQGLECPSVPGMTCGLTSCDAFRPCSDDASCGLGQRCYHGGILEWAGAVGECVQCELGCRCGDPGCPCRDASHQRRCQDASPFSGAWEGTFGGAASGTWRAWVETEGAVLGYHEGTYQGIAGGGAVSGGLQIDGQADLTAIGAGGATCPWRGTFTPSTAAGTWGCPSGESGTWSGQKGAALNAFRGAWSGTFGGIANGTWAVTIDSLGVISGSMSGTSPLGSLSSSVRGIVSPTGSVQIMATGSGAGGGCMWLGSARGRLASGTWTCPAYGGAGGTWEGSWQSAAYPGPAP